MTAPSAGATGADGPAAVLVGSLSDADQTNARDVRRVGVDDGHGEFAVGRAWGDGDEAVIVVLFTKVGISDGDARVSRDRCDGQDGTQFEAGTADGHGLRRRVRDGNAEFVGSYTGDGHDCGRAIHGVGGGRRRRPRQWATST